MSAVYRTARGRMIDIDSLRLANESVIAVGNMRTNARGDELGAGGQVVKTRSQLMQEYHKLNTPVIDDTQINFSGNDLASTAKLRTPTVDFTPINTGTPTKAPASVPTASLAGPAPTPVRPRGSLAEAIANETEVTQELLTPASVEANLNSVKRI